MAEEGIGCGRPTGAVVARQGGSRATQYLNPDRILWARCGNLKWFVLCAGCRQLLKIMKGG